MADQNFRVKRGLEVGIGGTIITAKSTGNVGISSTEPTVKLDVVGDVKATTFIGALTGTASTASNLNRSVTAGSGLSGGGTLTADVTLNVGAGSGITVNADDVQLKNAGSLTNNYLPKWDSTNTQLTNTNLTYVNTPGSGIGTLGIGTVISIKHNDTLNSGTLTFEGSAGQLLTITNNLTSGSIFSVNDSSGIPSIDVNANGTVSIAPFGVDEKVGIGTTLPTSKLHVVGDGYFTGIVTATDFNSASDAKLKTNIQPIEDPLNKVSQIQGVSFNWIENNKPSMGVIADEVQKILPELVSDTDPKTVNYNGLIGLLIEVVKDQQVKIESLEQRITKLE